MFKFIFINYSDTKRWWKV